MDCIIIEVPILKVEKLILKSMIDVILNMD